MSSLELNLQAMQASRDRLRRATQAIAGGQFANPVSNASNPQPLQTAALRTERMGNVMDAAFELMQKRVMTDISGAMDRLDALSQFNTTTAQTAYQATQAASQEPSHASSDVIDVQAKDISATPPTP